MVGTCGVGRSGTLGTGTWGTWGTCGSWGSWGSPIGGGGGEGGGGGGELWSPGGVSVDAGLLLPLAGGSPAPGAPGRVVPGEVPIGLPAVRGAVFAACPFRAFATAARSWRAGRATPPARSAAALRPDPACVVESSAATDSVRRFF